MARYFKTPESDQIEEVSAFQVLAILFLGVIYLLFAGLWRHLLIWVAAIGIGIIAGPPWIAIPGIGLPLTYCFFIRKIVADEYLKKGWTEVSNPKLSAKETSADV